MIDNFALFVTHLALLILGFRVFVWGDPDDGGDSRPGSAGGRAEKPVGKAAAGAARKPIPPRLRRPMGRGRETA